MGNAQSTKQESKYYVPIDSNKQIQTLFTLHKDKLKDFEMILKIFSKTNLIDKIEHNLQMTDFQIITNIIAPNYAKTIIDKDELRQFNDYLKSILMQKCEKIIQQDDVSASFDKLQIDNIKDNITKLNKQYKEDLTVIKIEGKDFYASYFNHILNNLFSNLEEKPKLVYLDIGTADGNKTTRFITQLTKFANITTHVADVDSWGCYDQELVDNSDELASANPNQQIIKKQHIIDKKNKKLNKLFECQFSLINPQNEHLEYPNEMFNFITCFLTLHHVQKLDLLVAEIDRCLAKNGYLLLIEHNVSANLDDQNSCGNYILLDLLHTLYGFIFDKKQCSITNPEFARYKHCKEWMECFKQFKIIDNKHIRNQYGKERYDKLMYIMFQKI